MDCIFCKILSGELSSKKILETGDALAIYDINPAAPFHAVVISKAHIPSMDAIDGTNSAAAGKMFECIAAVAAKEGLKSGYRVVCNCGRDAGQTVQHLHMHILAGRPLGDMVSGG